MTEPEVELDDEAQEALQETIRWMEGGSHDQFHIWSFQQMVRRGFVVYAGLDRKGQVLWKSSPEWAAWLENNTAIYHYVIGAVQKPYGAQIH